MHVLKFKDSVKFLEVAHIRRLDRVAIQRNLMRLKEWESTLRIFFRGNHTY